MPSAGGVFLGVVKRRNSMITDGASPASYASTEATYPTNPQLKALPSDHAIALPLLPSTLDPSYRRFGSVDVAHDQVRSNGTS
jgi:hypothetical protein